MGSTITLNCHGRRLEDSARRGGPAVPEVSSEDSSGKSKNVFTGPLTSIFHLPISCDSLRGLADPRFSSRMARLG
jgi:hypothetical protein